MIRALLTGIVLLCVTALVHADWRQFRGNSVDGLADEAVRLDGARTSPVTWQKDLPGRGLASPIVVGEQVIVTASSGANDDRLHVLSFDAATGAPQWHRQFWGTGQSAHHPKTSVAAPTPASDGERIFAFYSTNDVVCLDLQGNLLWFRGLTYDYPNASNTLGMSSSPLVAQGTLVCLLESDAESLATGLDVTNGQTRWKIDRPRKANWTSPVLLKNAEGASQVLLQGSQGVTAVDPTSGEELWRYQDGASTIPSSVVAGNIVYVPSHGITAMRPGQSNPSVPEVLWNEGSLRPGTASPIVQGERLYVVNGAGVLSAANRENGKRLWQLRLQGSYSGSPVIAGERLFIVSEKGELQVVALRDNDGEKIATHELGDTVLSTPAVADGALFVRGEHHLWKIGGYRGRLGQ
jgi:outer membrane protein assembly factor BamB